MDENVVIKVNNLKKKYKLGIVSGQTLREEIQTKLALLRGKEDPNSKIGSYDTDKKEFWALSGIDLEVHKGETLGILGRNGAGKSTLLKILSRITAPTEGTIEIKGRISSMLEVGTGFHSELTGRENIYLNAAILGMSTQEVDKKINDIIEFSECERFIDTPVKRYSSGMYVKLAFAVAAHLDSEILIMDEVLAVGDVGFQEKCINKMREMARRENRTVLYVSHNMNTIRKLCEKCIVLENGKIKFYGETEKAISFYMENGSAETDLSDIINDKPRRGEERVRFTSFEITNSSNGFFEQQASAEIKLGIRAFEDIDNVHVRFLLKYMDATIAGTFFSEKIDLKQQTDYGMALDMPFTVLPEGDFYITLILSRSNKLGSWENLILIENVANICIGPNKNNYNGMNWHVDWRVNLGTLKFKEMESVNIR